MTIRKKTILLLFAAFSFLALLSVVAFYLVVMPKFDYLERSEVHKNVDRVVKEVESQAEQMVSTSADWGDWDDTYNYMTGTNPDYVKDNLTLDSLVNLDIELFLLIDTTGKIVVERHLDMESHSETAPYREVVDYAIASRFWSPGEVSKPRSGLLMAGTLPVVFSSRPIRRSDKTGPPVGTIFVGRIIDNYFSGRISKKLNVNASFETTNSSEVFKEIKSVDPISFEGVEIYPDPADSAYIYGTAPIADVEDKPALVAKVRMERAIHASGLNAVFNAFFAIASVGLIFMALVVVIVDVTVLKRLSRITGVLQSSPRAPLVAAESREDEIGVLAAAISETFRREALRAEELEASEKQKVLALEGGGLGFWEYDLQTKTLFFSEKFMAQLGYHHLELPHTLETLASLISEEDRKVAMKAIRGAMEAQNPSWDLEYRMTGKDGQTRQILSRGRLVELSSDGEPKKISSTHMDVTERARELERKGRIDEQIRSAQKMKAIGTLAGGIAHNFNNILSAVMGYAELVLEDLEKGTPAHENAKQIILASHRASELVRQLLIFSQDREYHAEALDIRKIVEESFRFMREVVPTSIEMICTIPDTSAMVTCDPYLMREAIIAICTNAQEAMGQEEGRLIIAVTTQKDYQEEWELEGRDVVRITFSDDGCGMPQEVLDQAFDPYFTTKGGASRAGLGLSLVHGTVTECGGSVKMHSTVGVGTTLILTLPAVLGVEVPEVKRPSTLHGNERILFVDDERLLADIAKKHFTRLGYRITIFQNPVQALEYFLLDPKSIDILITDLTMPGMSGVELAAKIHQIRPRIPVFLCSGYIDAVSKEEKEAAAITHVLRKPMSIEDMAALIRNYFEGKD